VLSQQIYNPKDAFATFYVKQLDAVIATELNCPKRLVLLCWFNTKSHTLK
jgi:hypothetical protein